MEDSCDKSKTGDVNEETDNTECKLNNSSLDSEVIKEVVNTNHKLTLEDSCSISEPKDSKFDEHNCSLSPNDKDNNGSIIPASNVDQKQNNDEIKANNKNLNVSVEADMQDAIEENSKEGSEIITSCKLSNILETEELLQTKECDKNGKYISNSSEHNTSKIEKLQSDQDMLNNETIADIKQSESNEDNSPPNDLRECNETTSVGDKTEIKTERTEQQNKKFKINENDKDDDKTDNMELDDYLVKTELFEEEISITDVTGENDIYYEMDSENKDDGIEQSHDFYEDTYIGEDAELSKLESTEGDNDDAVIIESCNFGNKSNSDKSFIKEGLAEIFLSSPKNVFYNPVQEFNRDMSIAAITVFAEDHRTDPRYKNRGVKRKSTSDVDNSSKEVNNEMDVSTAAGTIVDNGITILEALSATGLRSIRYAKEISGIKKIIANDISQLAVENIKKNADHNGVGDIITTTKSDASFLMYQHLAADEWYDVIDLDPYGCPSRFLDAAVQAVRDGGMLLVTCTDMAVLAGNSPETCHVKYGAISLRNPACHEMAIRIALQCIESHANRYGRYIVPLVSFSADFYIRLIVQVYTSPVTCKRTTSKLSLVYQCVGCQSLTLNPLGLATKVGNNNQMKFSLPHSPPVNQCCMHCFNNHIVGGPIWSAPIHKISFVERMLRVAEEGQFATHKRMEGMLEVIREELPDVPLYYTLSGLCSRVHCNAIPLTQFRSALLNAGYRVSLSHASPTSIKTNAPVKILWDIIRCWVQVNPISQRRLVDGSVSAAILFQEPSLNANFEFHPKSKPNSRIRGLVRFQQNPQKNWGPGTRSRINVGDNLDERRRANQNKNAIKVNVDIIEVITLSNDDEETHD